MLYVIKLDIPANTPKTNPASTAIRIHEPILFHIAARFPAGCLNLAYVSIFYGELQIWPWREYEWVSGDDEVVWDVPFLEFKDYPYELTINGYNEDPDYDHTVYVRIIALEKRWIRWMPLLAKFTELFRRLIGL